MANSTKKEHDAPQTETVHTQSVVATPMQKESTSSNKRSLASILAIFIAMVALVFAIYDMQSNQKLQKKLLDENTYLNELQHKQNSNNEEIGTKTKEVQQTQHTIQKKLDQLTQEVRIELNQKFYQNQDWLLLKTRYYLELAQINAYWNNDIDTSIALLQQGDTLLKQVQSPKIFAIRQAIAKEIAVLNAFPKVDVAGVLSKLDAAQTSVDALTIQPPFEENKSVMDKTNSETPNGTTWRVRLQQSFSQLDKLIVIRRDTEDFKPLLSPVFASILKESIRLNLQQAQWAVLNRNADVYQLALKQALANLNRTFNKSSGNTSALIKQLNELQQIKITQDRPKIEIALPMLNQVIDNSELITTPVNNNGKGEH